jgi:hypothetical protein
MTNCRCVQHTAERICEHWYNNVVWYLIVEQKRLRKVTKSFVVAMQGYRQEVVS